MDVHLRDLRYFVAVAEELSFTRAAAERLSISQPALSKQIRQLEIRLRTELFDRSDGSVSLTAAGEALLPHARRMLADWADAVASVGEAAAATQQTVWIGLHSRAGHALVHAVAADVEARLPGWRAEFRQVGGTDPAAGLADGAVDVAIAWLPLPGGAGLSARVIAAEDRWVSLPAGHRLAGRTGIVFEDLHDEPFIALPAAAGPMRDFWLALDHRGTPPVIAGEAATAEELFDAVAAGVGIALLSEGNTDLYRRDDVVHRRVVDLPPCELAALWRSGDRRTAVRVVVDACERAAAGRATDQQD
ncbi:LysR family transcriptional regulator [Actinomycetes bacterium KLBMP 9759]